MMMMLPAICVVSILNYESSAGWLLVFVLVSSLLTNRNLLSAYDTGTMILGTRDKK